MARVHRLGRGWTLKPSRSTKEMVCIRSRSPDLFAARHILADDHGATPSEGESHDLRRPRCLLNSVAVCAVDETGKLIREGTTLGDAPSIVQYLEPWAGQVERVGLEAGPTSEWLTANLIELGLPAVSLEARQVKAALSAMPVKTDRNDARGIAQVVRTGWFKPVHVKSIGSQRARTLAAARKHIIRSIAAAEQVIRGLLRPLGLKIGIVSRTLFATRVRELVGDDALLEAIMNALLAGREALMREYARLHRLVLKAVRNDPACRLLMTMPGIGPVSALTFRSHCGRSQAIPAFSIRRRLSRVNAPAIPIWRG
ncbi:transposase [Bradyrhizobium japonicum]